MYAYSCYNSLQKFDSPIFSGSLVTINKLKRKYFSTVSCSPQCDFALNEKYSLQFIYISKIYFLTPFQFTALSGAEISPFSTLILSKDGNSVSSARRTQCFSITQTKSLTSLLARLLLLMIVGN
jgi:hypothetical protein